VGADSKGPTSSERQPPESRIAQEPRRDSQTGPDGSCSSLVIRRGAAPQAEAADARFDQFDEACSVSTQGALRTVGEAHVELAAVVIVGKWIL